MAFQSLSPGLNHELFLPFDLIQKCTKLEPSVENFHQQQDTLTNKFMALLKGISLSFLVSLWEYHSLAKEEVGEDTIPSFLYFIFTGKVSLMSLIK